MSSTKRTAADEAGKRIAMEEHLVAQGKLKKCTFHEVLFGGSWPDLDFKAKALRDLKSGASRLPGKLRDQDEDAFVELLGSTLESSSEPRCPLCSKDLERLP